MKYQRLAKILVKGRGGIEDLAKKLLDFYRVKFFLNILKKQDRPVIEINDNNLTEVLHMLIEKFKLHYQTIKNDPLFTTKIKK